jgi:hypothetical protein
LRTRAKIPVLVKVWWEIRPRAKEIRTLGSVKEWAAYADVRTAGKHQLLASVEEAEGLGSGRP